jgi:parvulin-like peptidyl-prolyl isomerase
MSPNLDLSVPSAKPPAPRTSRLVVFLLLLVIAGEVVAFLFGAQGGSSPAAGKHADLKAEPTRELALKLEKQGLNQAAAKTWQQYLQMVPADPEKKARIWYRIGTLRQNNGDFEQALAAYYRSEAHAKSKDIADDLGRRVQECLEALGKFAALRYELAERVGVKPDKTDTGDVVLAEIGSRKITKSELDRRIEEVVDRQLAQMAGQMTPEQRQKQKEALVSRFGTSAERQRFLQQYLIEQVLYLKAREDGLQNEPAVRTAMLDADRSVLANEVVQRALASRIQITPEDVKTFYEANKADFVTPAKAKIRHILLPDEEQAKAAINSLNAGQDFAELAKTASQDDATAAKGGELPGWVQAGAPSIPGIGKAPELEKAIFASKAGTLLPTPFKTDKGWNVVKVDELQPQTQRSFEDARNEAYRMLYSRKQQEIQKSLFEELRKHFDVVVHRDQLPAEKTEGEPGR